MLSYTYTTMMFQCIYESYKHYNRLYYNHEVDYPSERLQRMIRKLPQLDNDVQSRTLLSLPDWKYALEEGSYLFPFKDWKMAVLHIAGVVDQWNKHFGFVQERDEEEGGGVRHLYYNLQLFNHATGERTVLTKEDIIEQCDAYWNAHEELRVLVVHCDDITAESLSGYIQICGQFRFTSTPFVPAASMKKQYRASVPHVKCEQHQQQQQKQRGGIRAFFQALRDEDA
jgi:hypothetical protein